MFLGLFLPVENFILGRTAMRKIWVFAFLGLVFSVSTAEAKVCFLPGIFGGDESCLTDEQYAECRGFEQTRPCPAGQEQVTCTKGNKTYYHCYCRADTYNLIDHPEYRCKKGYTTECGCTAENLECAPEYVYKGDGLGHCRDWANTDGVGACVLPNGEVYYKDCQCNENRYPYSCRETGFKRPIDRKLRCEDPHGLQVYSKCVCDENAGWSENCAHRQDGCTQPTASNKVGEVTCSQCEEIACESNDLVNIEAYLCGLSNRVVIDCELLGYVYAPSGICPPGTGNEGKTGVKCPFDRNYMNCEPLQTCMNLTTCIQANEGATLCEEDPNDPGCYRVKECDTAKGYYFDGQTCQISACPIGYSTSTQTCVGEGYSKEESGISGGETCVKCVCAPSEDCVYTPKTDISVLSINGRSVKSVYAGMATVSDMCCNGYFKTCNSLCQGRDLLADYDANMEEYELCEACGKKYYTITKCKDSFSIRDGKCEPTTCDIVNGFNSKIENVSQCETSTGLYKGALGWKLEVQKDSAGKTVQSAGANCTKCVCSEPAVPSSTDACRWNNLNKNTNGYLIEEDLCCNGYYKACHANFPATATPEACTDENATQKDAYGACDLPVSCVIRSCANGYVLENNKCVSTKCPDPYTTTIQNVSDCGTGTGWSLLTKKNENNELFKSGGLNCTQCQCNAASNCQYTQDNKGTATLSDLCCNGTYATCTSECTGHLEKDLVTGSNASVEHGVKTKTECKACSVSYWTATACQTDNGYVLTSDGRCEHVGCPAGYTAGLKDCPADQKYLLHTNTDNGVVCGKCTIKACADYEDEYTLEEGECPAGWACEYTTRQLSGTTKKCYKKVGCDSDHCGPNCETATNVCTNCNYTAIDHADMSGECQRITGGGTHTCVGPTTVYSGFTCKAGWQKDGDNACKKCTCEDCYSSLTQCTGGYSCAETSRKIGDEYKTCYTLNDCDANHCGINCATTLEPCTGYNYTASDIQSIAGAVLDESSSNVCYQITLSSCPNSVKKYKSFNCDTASGYSKSGNTCVRSCTATCNPPANTVAGTSASYNYKCQDANCQDQYYKCKTDWYWSSSKNMCVENCNTNSCSGYNTTTKPENSDWTSEPCTYVYNNPDTGKCTTGSVYYQGWECVNGYHPSADGKSCEEDGPTCDVTTCESTNVKPKGTLGGTSTNYDITSLRTNADCSTDPCYYKCDSTHHKDGNNCADNCEVITCDNSNLQPANTTVINTSTGADFTKTSQTSDCQHPYCYYQCNSEWHKSGDVCVTDCTPQTCSGVQPSNTVTCASSNASCDFVIDIKTDRLCTPSTCYFNCNSSAGYVKSGSSCLCTHSCGSGAFSAYPFSSESEASAGGGYNTSQSPSSMCNGSYCFKRGAAKSCPTGYATSASSCGDYGDSLNYSRSNGKAGDSVCYKCFFNCQYSSQGACESANTGFSCSQNASTGCFVTNGCKEADGYYEDEPTDSWLIYNTASVNGVTCYYNLRCNQDQKYFDSTAVGTAACSSLTPPDGTGWMFKPTYTVASAVPKGSKNCFKCTEKTCASYGYWEESQVPATWPCKNKPVIALITVGDYTPTNPVNASSHGALCIQKTCNESTSCTTYTEANGWISYTSGTATAACVAKYGIGYTSTNTVTCNDTKYTKCAAATSCAAISSSYMDASSLDVTNNLEYLYKEVAVNGLTCYDKTDKKAFSDFAATNTSKWETSALRCAPNMTDYNNGNYPVEAFYGTTQTSSSNICNMMIVRNGAFTYYTSTQSVPCKTTVGSSVYKGFTANNHVLLQSDALVTGAYISTYVCCGQSTSPYQYSGWRQYLTGQQVQSTSCVLNAHQTGAGVACGLCYMR